MSWLYKQSTGEISQYGVLEGVGYSGTGTGRNSPSMQNVHDVGPIPQGVYHIGVPFDHPVMGPHVLPLTPMATDQMFSRSGFYMHGDNEQHDASHGCIIMSRAIREEISKSGDTNLVVKE